METREWALVTYTILSQMAIGSFLVLGAIHFWAQRRAGEAEADRLSDRALLAIGPVLVLGVLASLLHLGNPMNAYRAITNFGSSWLSREIFFTMAFTGVGFVFAIMQWRKIATPTIRMAVAAAAAIIGVASVYSMSHIYMLPNQPSWNTAATPLSFFATTLLLGSLAIGVALSVNYSYIKSRKEAAVDVQANLLRESLRWIAVAAIVVLGFELVVVSASLVNFGSGDAADSLVNIANDYNVLFILRIGLVFLGAGVFAFFLYRTASVLGQERVLFALIYGAFALVLIAEVMGRYLFYASHIKIGF
ncbi:MAG TPA: dimethyl sulfoxide reductase anchor subunit [Aggregatilinea sp.]|uniref:dimethyl sulfoxide reductase anchor subunit family protein n=1 Tax=Aggregatilinea sp. TaxID=2806333 RepID=UPI002C105C0A|nr:DmsC/YnfH family molybdoenzyme membrane anchor subunit [Aggregatilinea sp.]HML20548.1 dimethyl sulfoxide reductase anchor subunit [Aggregatilinea sp.]